MPIIQLVQAANRVDQPLVCFLDLQLEYVAEGRALALEASTPWMENCRRLLALARSERMSIAHFRQLRRGTVLNPATGFANWIEEFRPRPSEMVFERALPSCYAAERFASVLDHIDHPVIVLAGLTGHGACLATVLDGFHRRHRFIYVSDASSTPRLGSLDAVTSHACVTEIIGDYAEVGSTEGTIKWLRGLTTKAGRVGESVP
jgi:nicotinamidase-related amidase